MRNILNIPAIILLLFISAVSYGQEIKPRALLDSNRILIGDQVRIHLEVEFTGNVKIHFPNPADSLAKFVEIVERLPLDSVTVSNDRKKLYQEFIITSFDSGVHTIPPFLFTFNINGKIDSVKSNPLLLFVYTLPKLDSLMKALKGPIDIKPPFEAPITFKEIAPWIMGGMLVLALLFLIFYSLRRRKNNQGFFTLPPKPKEPAHVIALRELDRIKEEKIWQQGMIKLYYSEITDVLRQYIENRFDIPAMENTTEETILAFKYRRSLVDEKSFENLRKVLTNADLVKFAKFEPLPDDNNLVLVDSYFFINQTKVVDVIEVNKPVDDREGNDVNFK
jgi:uncharacterized protein (UPF0335 family)